MLLIGATRHYAWDWFPMELKGVASKGLGGLALLAMIWTVYKLRPSGTLALVMLWWAFEELQVVLCSAWFMFDPWPVAPGQAMCSAKVGFDIGAIGIMIISVLLIRVSTPVKSSYIK